jgi:hypothetical protein
MQAEVELLIQAAAFKSEFDKFAKGQDVKLPRRWSEYCCDTFLTLTYGSAFYFNSEGAVLGKLVQNQDGNGSSDSKHGILYKWFLATRLLPRGPYDAKLQKFTGNDDAGNAPAKDDYLSMALFCDLQGI